MTIMAAITAASALVNTLAPIMEERRRKRELTPEEEAQWDQFVEERMSASHWKPSQPTAGR